ncbi:MAG TPA: hypothetical protein VNP97_08805, partial [Microbacterium sp.]|nr:hypothetical protein [Microbacterium sp.]
NAFAADALTFLAFASQHPELTFLLTPVGCGIAGYAPEEARDHGPSPVGVRRLTVRAPALHCSPC